jgi:hypothetical protein
MESVSEQARSWVLMSLEGGMSCPNLDATDERKQNSATVPKLEYYDPIYSLEPRFNWDKQVLVEQD